MSIIDLFAGPGGWDTGAAFLGVTDIVGVEWDEKACQTARAAGHRREQLDVAEVTADEMRAMAPVVDGLIASPPCQAWSRAGKRGGILDQPRIFTTLAAAHDYIRDGHPADDAVIAACLDQHTAHNHAALNDPRSLLVLEPLRWALTLRPRWIACEQVPDVLPFWHRMAAVLRDVGYKATAGVLSSERYGVPQTRQRAILVARLDGPATLPPATHHAYDARDDGDDVPSLFDVDLDPWVSMAEALGWGLPDRPSWAVTAGGTETGGAEVFANASSRRRLAMLVAGATSPDTAGARPRPSDEPSATITGKGTAVWTSLQGNHTPGGATERIRRNVEAPSITVTSSARSFRWVTERPATTTVQGDPRIAEPGHRDREGGVSQFDGESVRVSVEEAACLQSFPVGYPWQGNKGERYRQIGDAVPPLLATAILGNLLAIPGWRDICRYAYRGKAAA